MHLCEVRIQVDIKKEYLYISRRVGPAESRFRISDDRSPMKVRLLPVCVCLLFLAAAFTEARSQILPVKCSWPYGGPIWSLGASRSGFIVTGSRWGGVFLSSDHGVSWESISVPAISSIYAVAVNDQGEILGGLQSPENEPAVYCSKDTGRSWRGGFWPYSVFNGANMTAMIPGYGWFVSHNEGALTFSSDKGKTWHDVDYSGNSFVDIALDSLGGLVTASHYTFRRSTDDGASWSMSLITGYAAGMTVSSLGTICLAAGDSVLRSTNNGQSWTALPRPASIYSVTAGYDGNLYLGTMDGVYRSTDDGVSWHSLGLKGFWMTDVAAESTGHVHAISYDGFFTLEPGESVWKRRTIPLPAYVNSLLADATGRLYAATPAGLHISDDGGMTWQYVEQAYSSALSLGLDKKNKLLVGTLGMQMFQLPITTTSVPTYWPLNVAFQTIAVADDNTYYGGTVNSYGVLRSTDEGDSWWILGLDQNWIFSVDVDSAGVVYAGTGGALYTLAPGDSQWVHRTGSLPEGAGRAVLASNSGRIILGAFHGIYLSDSSASSWYRAQDSLYESDIHTLIETIDGSAVAAASNGLFRSTDNGLHWEAWGGTTEDVVALASDSSGTVYYVPFKPTYPKRSPLASVETVSSVVPADFRLSAYPNPFNPSTKIGIAVPTSSKVKLSIYDILGREMATLVNEEMYPGEYSVVWDARQLASGIYFARIESSESVKSIRLVLLK